MYYNCICMIDYGVAAEFTPMLLIGSVPVACPHVLSVLTHALTHMGAFVVSGVMIAKLVSVFVLFFTRSPLFDIFYFRMYMLMLLWRALHGLVFLPVLLSYVGECMALELKC